MHAAPPDTGAPASLPRFPLRRGFELSAVAALFMLTLRQLARGRRLLLFCFLFMLPIMVALLVKYLAGPPESTPAERESVLAFVLIPNALVPLLALLYGCGMIQDEIEEQTLTYLLVRPLPRWAIYLAKLAATLVMTAALAGCFLIITYLAIYWGVPELWKDVLVDRALKMTGLTALSLIGYCAFFGCLSLLVRWSLLVGVAYIVLFEGLLANVDFAINRLTVMYYIRVLRERWLVIDPRYRRLDLDQVPTSGRCLEILLLASLALVVLGCVLFTTREFRVKTPAGS